MTCPHKIYGITHVGEIGSTGSRQNINHCRLKQSDISLLAKMSQHEADNYLSSGATDICPYSETNEHNCPWSH